MLPAVATDLKSSLPGELVDGLLAAFEELKRNYLLDRHEPAELNGGKFCEATYRILQHQTQSGTYTLVSAPIPNMIEALRALEQVPKASSKDSYRIHIPRVLQSMYNIRNQRGVGHMAGDVNPNLADSTLLVVSAEWVLAELFRIHYKCSLPEAQAIVDSLVTRPSLLVYKLNDVRRVLLPSLPLKDQTLLLLDAAHPDSVLDDELIRAIEAANPSYFKRKVLSQLHRGRLLEYSASGECTILPPGSRYVDASSPAWLRALHERGSR